MQFVTKRNRTQPSVNASSMADIAFLLLVFFLVATTIDIDKGIRVRLPIWYENYPVFTVSSKNILTVLVNTKDDLLVEGEQMPFNELRATAKTFIMNPEQSEKLPSNPKRAIISLQNDRGTTYSTYVTIYNELKAAYNELWDEAAMQAYNLHFDDLDKTLQKEIRNSIPLVISEAELTSFGG